MALPLGLSFFTFFGFSGSTGGSAGGVGGSVKEGVCSGARSGSGLASSGVKISTGAPQLPQKRWPSAICAPHFVQNIWILLSFSCFSLPVS